MYYLTFFLVAIITLIGTTANAQITYDNGLPNLLAGTVEEPISVTNVTSLEVTGTVDVDNLSYASANLIDVDDNSILTINGGSVGFQFGPDDPTGIRLQDGSQGAINSGLVDAGAVGVQVIDSIWSNNGGDVQAGFESIALGIDASGTSTLNLAGGTIWANSDNATGLHASGNTFVALSGGLIVGLGAEAGGTGAVLSDDAMMTMTGGQIDGDSFGDYVVVSGLVLEDNSSTMMSGGSITSVVGDQLGGSTLAVTTKGNSYFELTGGTVASHIGDDLGNPDITSIGIMATDNSVVSICGGDIETSADFPSNATDIVALDDSTIFVCASSVEIYELFEPITDFEGHLRGISLDGTPFDYAFTRSATAQLMFVPEPRVGLWLATMVLPTVRLRRHFQR